MDEIGKDEGWLDLPKEISKRFLSFGNRPGTEKLVIGRRDRPMHMTFMIKANNGVYEYHAKYEMTGRNPRYFNIIQIPVNVVNEILNNLFLSFISDVITMYTGRRINPGRLKRYGFVLIPMKSDSAEHAEKFIESKKRRLKAKTSIPHSAFEILKPHEIYSANASVFILLKVHRKKGEGGFIYKREVNGKSVLTFIKTSDFNQFSKSTINRVIQLLDQSEFRDKEKLITWLQSNRTI